jgi:hypothetical protein
MSCEFCGIGGGGCMVCDHWYGPDADDPRAWEGDHWTRGRVAHWREETLPSGRTRMVRHYGPPDGPCPHENCRHQA